MVPRPVLLAKSDRLEASMIGRNGVLTGRSRHGPGAAGQRDGGWLFRAPQAPQHDAALPPSAVRRESHGVGGGTPVRCGDGRAVARRAGEQEGGGIPETAVKREVGNRKLPLARK